MSGARKRGEKPLLSVRLPPSVYFKLDVSVNSAALAGLTIATDT